MGCSCCHLPQPREDEDGARQKEDRLLLLGAEWKTSVLDGLFPSDPAPGLGELLQLPRLQAPAPAGLPSLRANWHKRL